MWDRDGYPPNWGSVIRPAVLYRANGVCEGCRRVCEDLEVVNVDERVRWDNMVYFRAYCVGCVKGFKDSKIENKDGKKGKKGEKGEKGKGVGGMF